WETMMNMSREKRRSDQKSSSCEEFLNISLAKITHDRIIKLKY
ncbi:5753_t:CDS:2, partial [Entrophospora sp. SA101]